MKKQMTGAFVIGALFILLALTGCDTPTDTETENRYDDTGRTYKFNADGTYQFKKGENVLDGGSYLVKDDSLFLLRDYSYGSPDAAAAAVERFDFSKDDTAHTISLRSGLGTTSYSLDHGGVTARTLEDDSLKGKKWRSGLNAGNMWNVWDFNEDGTFQYIHHHSETNTKDVGLFSYFVHNGYLVTVAPGRKNTETGPSFDPYQVSAYSLKSLDLTFSASPAASGGSAAYTLVHETPTDESAHSYEFVNDGTYKYDDTAAGNYIIRNNVLVLLPTSTYSDANAALDAAQKWFFTVSADSKISLISDTETHIYSLTGTFPPSIAAPESDALKGKILSAKSSAQASMWNWYGFRDNGTFHYYHFMSGRADYIDRGDFSYLLQGDKLIILSAFDSDTKNPAPPPYTLAAYTVTVTAGNSDTETIAFAKASNNPASTPNTVTLRNPEVNTAHESDTTGYDGFPPEHYDDGFSGSGSGSGGGGDGGGHHH
ncbi:MAG: hypothetical protein LBP29_00625 [Treponema sp.]|jgi:hypothetical protein|nr:hypothetical protein [Treponema sp.]